MRLSETAAVITGGSSGLGAATARLFRTSGAQVTIFDQNTDLGAKLANEIGADFVEADVTDAASVGNAFASAYDKMGKITAAISCAGIATSAKTLGRDGPHDLGLFRRTIDINLVGSFNVARLAAAEMAKNAPLPDGTRGVVINTASIAAFDGQKGQAAYAASKAGIAGLSLPMARDLAREGVRVMAIAPGVFLTPMLEGLPADVTDELARDVTFPKRLGDPVEFASLARFIVECDYLNGEVIRLDGGLRMK